MRGSGAGGGGGIPPPPPHVLQQQGYDPNCPPRQHGGGERMGGGGGFGSAEQAAAHFQAQCRELERQLHMSIDAERKAQNQIQQLQLMSKSQTAILRTNLNNKVRIEPSRRPASQPSRSATMLRTASFRFFFSFLSMLFSSLPSTHSLARKRSDQRTA